jgi:F0F1-type ATP synthase epsilon subunit
MTLLGEGVLTVRKPGGETSQFQVAGGFLQVLEDTVRVVVERAE